MAKKNTQNLMELPRTFWTIPHNAWCTLDTKSLKHILLQNDGRLIAKGGFWDIKTKRIGPMVYKVWLEKSINNNKMSSDIKRVLVNFEDGVIEDICCPPGVEVEVRNYDCNYDHLQNAVDSEGRSCYVKLWGNKGKVDPEVWKKLYGSWPTITKQQFSCAEKSSYK